MKNLAAVLRKWRLMSELDVRSTAKKMGLGVATYSRIERGYAPSGETLAKVLGWLMASEENHVR